MRIRVITPTNGTPAYICCDVGDNGIIESRWNELRCYGVTADDDELPAFPDGYSHSTKLKTLQDFEELRAAMCEQFGF